MATVNRTYTGIVTRFAGPPEESGRGYATTSYIKVEVDGQEPYVRSKPGDDDYYFLRSVSKGDKVDVILLRGGGGGTYWKIVPPDGWQPDPALLQKIQLEASGAPQQKSVTEEPERVDIDDSGEEVRQSPSPPQQYGQTWQPMRPVDRLQAYLMAQDQAEMLPILADVARQAAAKANLVNISDDQIAAWTTSLWLQYASRRHSPLNPKEHGLRVPLMPAEVRQALEAKVNRDYPDQTGKVATNAALFKKFIATMSDYFRSDDERHAALKYLFGVESSKDLVEGQMRAFLDWAGDDPPSPVTLIEIEELRKVI